MKSIDEIKVVVRGGGDLATGIIQKLVTVGFKVICIEIDAPTAIRRNVALSEAMTNEGRCQLVENIKSMRVDSIDVANKLAGQFIDNEGEKIYYVPMISDAYAEKMSLLNPDVVVDAILAKKNLGTTIDMADVVIGVGPGFTAGLDVDYVIETQRGHNLGRVIYEGSAAPNTGIPGEIGGESIRRVYHSECSGYLQVVKDIGSIIHTDEVFYNILSKSGKILHTEKARFSGVVRGILKNGTLVKKGLKTADVDPRMNEIKNCSTISDKARCIAGGVVEAVFTGLNRNKISNIEKNIYLDTASTCSDIYPKSLNVFNEELKKGNWSSRSNGIDSIDNARKIFAIRNKISNVLGTKFSSEVVFTSGATMSLNMAIKGVAIKEYKKYGKKIEVITTDIEHNSVLRPLYSLENNSIIDLKIIKSHLGYITVDDIKNNISENTKLVVLSHVSNVLGTEQPIYSIGELLKEKKIQYIVDISQSCGYMDIDFEASNATAMCTSSHKGMRGLQGIGLLLVKHDYNLETIIEGGTGFDSFNKSMPLSSPERYEAGTLPFALIMSLGELFDNYEDILNLNNKSIEKARYFYDKLSNLKNIKIYSVSPKVPIVSFNLIDEYNTNNSNNLVTELEKNKYVFRYGAHCAPIIHEALGTDKTGIIRLSFTDDINISDIDKLLELIQCYTY